MHQPLTATDTAPAPRIDREKAIRILAVVVGIVGGLIGAFLALVFTGLPFWFTSCDSYEVVDSWICTGGGRPFLFLFEAVLPFATAALVLAGSIATAVTRRFRWLFGSAAIACLCAAIAIEVAEGRVSLLS